MAGCAYGARGIGGKRNMTSRWFLIGAILAGVPSPAFAYIDPGILGTLFQAAYAFLFGVVAVWIFKPWHYIKSFFTQQNGDGRKAEAGARKRHKATE